MTKKIEKSPEREVIERKITQLMLLAAHDSNITVRQIARKDAGLLRLQLETM